MTYHVENLTSESISNGLAARVVGRRVLCYPSLPSTMDVAREQSRQGAEDGTVIIADEQTAGRGRLKRSWFAPTGNIALSIILYPPDPSSLIMMASLAVADAIEASAGIKPEIKWPNDLLINGKKACGMLVELDSSREPVAAIVGIGINVNLAPADFTEIASTATSLSIEAGKMVSRLKVVRDLLMAMDRSYGRLKEGFSFFEEWRQRLVTIGKAVHVTSVEGSFDGTAEAVDDFGRLVVRDEGGTVRTVVAGDVTLRR